MTNQHSCFPAIAVANYFIQKSIEESALLTPLKLIKLCYISQGIHLLMYKKLLFAERCEAWKYGPVIPEIYAEFKAYGKNEIKSFGGYPSIDDQKKPIYPSVPEENEDAISAMKLAWDEFKQYSGSSLSAWTHRKDSAWSKAMDGKKGYDNPPITPDMLRTEFEGIMSN